MKVIDLLARWKVIPLGTLHNILPRKINKTYSYRLADKLMKAGVAHKLKCRGGNFQVLIPTEAALDCTGQYFNTSQFNDYCRHAFIASALIELPVFRNKNVRFQHEEHDEKLIRNNRSADFTINGVNSKATVYHMGVFFEPSHHSRSNSYEKMMRFVDKENFDVIVLIFETLDDLKKRRELYFENRGHKYGKELKEYICLVHIDDYFKHPREINKSFVYFQNEETTLEELFK